MIASLRRWHWSRWLRAGMAVAFIGQGWSGHDPMAFLIGGFFGVQALFDLGCGMNGCRAPQSNDVTAVSMSEYTEVASRSNADITKTAGSFRAN
jgi:hypothetical protein